MEITHLLKPKLLSGAIVACLAKSVCSIYVVIAGIRAADHISWSLLSRDCIDAILWFLIALLSLHIILYRESVITRKRLAVASLAVVLFAMLRLVSAVVCTLSFIDDGLGGIIYSVIELLLLAYFCLYVGYVLYNKYKYS